MMNNYHRLRLTHWAGMVGRISPSQRGSIYSIKMRVITSICPSLLGQHRTVSLGDGRGEMRIGEIVCRIKHLREHDNDSAFTASVRTLEPVRTSEVPRSVRVGFLREVNTLNPQSMTQDLQCEGKQP